MPLSLFVSQVHSQEKQVCNLKKKNKRTEKKNGKYLIKTSSLIIHELPFVLWATVLTQGLKMQAVIHQSDFAVLNVLTTRMSRVATGGCFKALGF